MPRGFTTLTLHGGPYDGAFFESVPAMNTRFGDIGMVFPVFGVPAVEEPYLAFAKTKERPKNWLSGVIALYIKQAPVKGRTGTHYSFQENRLFRRCMAVTQKGSRCNNECQDESHFCETAHKALRTDWPFIDLDANRSYAIKDDEPSLFVAESIMENRDSIVAKTIELSKKPKEAKVE